MVEGSELWEIMHHGPHVLILEVKKGKITRVIPKTRQQYPDADKKIIEKN